MDKDIFEKRSKSPSFRIRKAAFWLSKCTSTSLPVSHADQVEKISKLPPDKLWKRRQISKVM